MTSNAGHAAAPAGSWHGVLLLDKPAGITSSAAVQSVRRLFGRVKAGHTGTLDPMATGLLPVCLGEATKFAAGLLDANKIYEAVIRLGIATDTGDADGETTFQGSIAAVREHVAPTIAQFIGEIQQVPPMYSAIKYRGRALYRYARSGEEVPREPRRVVIEQLVVLSQVADDLTVRIECSKGTYIRALAHDIGERLGCGAHLTALRRVGIGSLRIEDSVRWEALQAATDTQRAQWVWPTDILVARLPAVQLDPLGARAVLQGQATALRCTASQGAVRLYDDQGRFLGLGSTDGNGTVMPKRMRSAALLERELMAQC
jgi:tRNA pseudouridine55 synthase